MATKGGIVGVIGYGLGVIGAGLAIGLAAYGCATAMARQPEIQGRAFTVFIMGAAFAEALALIGFVVALVVQ
nr:ATP synthase F0 subunit C [Collinsella tanakaei]